MHKYLIIALISFLLLSCGEEKEAVDQIVSAARIYTGTEDMGGVEAMAIRDGKIIATGSKEDILDRYSSENVASYEGYIFPGLIDAHSHFYGYALTQTEVDLKGTISMDDVVNRTVDFALNSTSYWIKGRGWDQNDWVEQGFPNNLALSLRIPDKPVLLKRIDGHAALANMKALELAGIDINTKVSGGEIEVRNGQLTGLLIDNAVDLVTKVIDKPSRETEIQALLTAQENCIKKGLTCVTDAGLDKEYILLMDSLQESGDLKIRLYLMCNPTEENFEHFGKTGVISKPRLQVSSFKVYADGALGSYGALLKQPYCDKDDHYGFWITVPDELQRLYQRIYDIKFQAGTHCIGDSANHVVLQLYGNLLGGKNDLRWRIEHAQVVSPEDRHMFLDYSIIPSVQPTHATSDMYWADKRLCPERLDEAYAYHSLLENSNYIALGTDFPVEDIDPLKTIHAAIQRTDDKNYPPGGYRPNEALGSFQTLLGMTNWASKACFMDDRIGTLEPGKYADFIVCDGNLLTEGSNLIHVQHTWIQGEMLN